MAGMLAEVSPGPQAERQQAKAASTDLLHHSADEEVLDPGFLEAWIHKSTQHPDVIAVELILAMAGHVPVDVGREVKGFGIIPDHGSGFDVDHGPLP